MPLRVTERDSPGPSLWQREATQTFTLAMPELPEILCDDAFHWFLQWRHPGLTLTRSTMKQGGPVGQKMITLVDSRQETMIQLTEKQEGQWCGQQYGERKNLWLKMEGAYEEWSHCGKPGRHAYHVEIAEHAVLVLSTTKQEKRFPL